MENIIQILTSPVWWSTAVAFLGVILGLNLYIDKVRKEDKAIQDKRREQQQSLEEKSEQ